MENARQNEKKCQFPGCSLTAMDKRPYCFDHFMGWPQQNAIRDANRRDKPEKIGFWKKLFGKSPL